MRPVFILVTLVAVTGLAPHPCSAQEPFVRAAARQEGSHPFTGPLLAHDHWSLEALRRVEALGLLKVYLPAQRAVPLDVVERSLWEAAERAPARAPGLTQLTREWHARLLAEFPQLDGIVRAGVPAAALPGGNVALGMELRRGAAAPGLGEIEPHRSGALTLDDRALLVGRGDVMALFGRHLAVRAGPSVSREATRLDAVELTGGWGPWSASLGRMPIGYAHGEGGGVALTGHATLDAAGIQTRSPLRLPWILSHLGPVSFTTHFARMREERHPGDPYFWTASGQFRPHRRVTLGVHRAALFGGSHPEEQRVTFGGVVDMLIGRVAGVGFEDQIVTVSGRYHLPTESLIPLTAYLEWGAEDAAGAWWSVPGRVIGLESVSLPFAPSVRAGVEYAHFEPSCCGNPQWYRHWSFDGSWATGDRTLGHPLGGDGQEALAHATAYLRDSSVRVSVRAFVRSRREENLYSPGRTGRGYGAAGEVEWRPSPRTELQLQAHRENGEDWGETNLRLEGRVFF